MYEAVNERDDTRTGCFYCEGELLDYLGRVSMAGDFWDVYVDGHLSYYYSLS